MELSTPISQIRRGVSGQPQPQQPDFSLPIDQQPTQQQQIPPPPSMQQQMHPPPSSMQQQQMHPPPSSMQQQGTDEDRLVDDILNDMVDNAKDDMNVGTANYAMSDSQIPPEKLDGNYLSGNENINDMITLNDEYNGNIDNTISVNNYMSIDFWLNKAKYPVLVFALFFILSLSQFNRLLFGFLPNLLNENGTITLYGNLLKSLIAMIIYICASYIL